MCISDTDSRGASSRPASVVQGIRGALNALLYRTGDQSRDFVVVLATNRPGDLDAAVVDRMDEALNFELPGEPERAEILAVYLESYLLHAGSSTGTRSGGARGDSGGPGGSP